MDALRRGLSLALLLTPITLPIALADDQTAGGDSKPLTKAEQEVLAQNQAYCDAIVKGDVPALERILADDFIITSGDGTLRDKAGELKDLAPTDDLKTLFFKTDELRLRVYESAAVLVGRARWRINYKGRELDNERRFTSVFVKQQGVWRIVTQQMTRPPQRPQPQ